MAGEAGIELLSTDNLQLLPVESLQSAEMAKLMKQPVSFLMTANLVIYGFVAVDRFIR